MLCPGRISNHFQACQRCPAYPTSELFASPSVSPASLQKHVPPFSRHPMFGPMPPVSKLPVAETAFAGDYRGTMSRLPMVLRVRECASVGQLACLYYLATTQAATTGRPAAQDLRACLWVDFDEGPRSGPLATLEKAGTGSGGGAPTSI
ncbi:hypothetical protein KVR01_001499 [Diaporthe batatas]|uniref:uncharacterized protein n=1 Tax=Diaporthe batatas TaxID=748121 RepID=UPI001D055E8E|nr:uncharacterized protein KVR01_001499 [Diaporthe batatas]KAG8168750.1 hypothetical protein KVR01_001499 [Diaporthe batatas]